MADSKANDLVKRVWTTLAELVGVRIWTQKDGEPDALGLDVSELLTSDVVQNNSNNYQALTPQGFYNSAATYNRRGTVFTALAADVISKSGTGSLLSAQQGIMQTQWKKDLFDANGRPSVDHRNVSDLSANGGALSWSSNWAGDLGAGDRVILSPSITGARFLSISFTYTITLGTYGLGSAILFFQPIIGTGSDRLILVYINGAPYGWFYVNSAGTEFGYTVAVATTDIRLSIRCNATVIDT